MIEKRWNQYLYKLTTLLMMLLKILFMKMKLMYENVDIKRINFCGTKQSNKDKLIMKTSSLKRQRMLIIWDTSICKKNK